MSEAWSEGYFTDATYTCGYYRELSPAMIRFCLLLQKIMPPPGEDITYCELGYGQGLSLNIHAATVPGTFVGTDFNPVQTAGARQLCAASGSPLELYNDSFEEFISRDLPQFNYIGLHGIWSWINDQNRERIVEFVRTHLKVGGAFYISYNCYPGLAAVAPLRNVLYLHDKYLANTNAASARVEQAFSFAERMMQANPNYTRTVNGIVERIQKMKSLSPNYLCHEYLNENWDIMYFTDVVNRLTPAKVSFAASANPAANMINAGMSPESSAFLAEIDNPLLREQCRDYFVNAQFRKDIFVRGGIPLSGVEQRDLLLQQRFVLMTPQQPEEIKVTAGMGTVTLHPQVSTSVMNALKDNDYAPRTLQSLSEQLGGEGIDRNAVTTMLVYLVEAGYVAPCQSQEAGERCAATARSCNAALCRKARTSTENHFLASPVTGGGVAMSRMEQLMLEIGMKGGDVPMTVWKIMKENGETVAQNGVAINNEVESMQVIAKSFVEFQKRLPVLKALGIAY